MKPCACFSRGLYYSRLIFSRINSGPNVSEGVNFKFCYCITVAVAVAVAVAVTFFERSLTLWRKLNFYSTSVNNKPF